MLNSHTQDVCQESEVQFRRRKTVRRRPLLGAPSLGFKITSGSGAFLQHLEVSLKKVEGAGDRRDASRALLQLQQVYKNGHQHHSQLPVEMRVRVEASLTRVGLNQREPSQEPAEVVETTFPIAIRDSLEALFGTS